MFDGPVDRRKATSNRLLESYPDRVPVIVNRPNTSTPPINKNKYLVPVDLIMSKLIHEVRKNIPIDSRQALFFFVDGFLIPNNESLGKIYNRYKKDDGFLYVTYATENTFG